MSQIEADEVLIISSSDINLYIKILKCEVIFIFFCLFTGFLDYQIHRTQNGKIEKPIFSLMTFPHKLGSSQTFFHLCEKIIDNPYVNGEVIKLDAGVNTILL